jgi:S-adenosylmethionine decarboxylase
MTEAFLSRAGDSDGAELEQRFAASGKSPDAAVNTLVDNQQDFFVTRDGMTFAGTHLIIDLYDAESLDDPDRIEDVLIEAARKAGATVLSSKFHHFTPNGGVSGVVVLAESHISIHTWPERGYAALDVFMCGQARPIETVAIVRDAFRPSRVGLSEIRRGVMG